MVRAEIYAEGGGPPGRVTNIRCREGFTKLIERCGVDSGKFDVIACGGRGDAWNDFQDAHAEADEACYVALLIDSETPLADIEEAWKHLEFGDGWQKPPDAQDDQVLFMTTCMETWIVADRKTLLEHFGENLDASALPELDNLEERRRGYLNDRLESATLLCPDPFNKGRNSFQVLGKIDPNVLEEHLPSFRRVRRILRDKLV